MNTNQLKKFAQDARKKLLEQVGAKLSFVLTTDSPELREKAEQVNQLREELSRISKEQLIEKVAYTWFNRLMAIRFMDANDYQPFGIRVITPKDGYTIPEMLDEAKRGNIPDELKLKRQRVYDLLDNRIPSTNPQNEAYKDLLIAACNHLNTVFPFLFEKISDYTELLMPDDLTSDFSIVTDIREGMPTEDCKNVEIIGWLYQFYISEENERLIKSKKAYQKNELAPASQLFTPKWIVRYMVDNTLGQILTEFYPATAIIKQLEFYIKPAYINQLPLRQKKKLEEIKFFDPCVGSAHILSYAFDVFYLIYKEQGYNESEIPELIIKNNLFGTDIDERAAQLSSFILMMKGRQYFRRFLKKDIRPNIAFFKDFEFDNKFKNAGTIGSLINVDPDEINKIVVEENSLFGEKQMDLKRLYKFLGKRYDLVVTNPPYISSSRMEGTLKQFVESYYPETKSDLFATFIIRCLELCNENGLTGYMSPFVWMFISSYEKLRESIINNNLINNLIQLEYSGFEGATVPICTFTLRKKRIPEAKGSYIRLTDFSGARMQAPKTLFAIQNPDCNWFYIANQDDFKKIPGSSIGYWASQLLLDTFKEKPISDSVKTSQGMKTLNNDRFIRYWSEVELQKSSSIISKIQKFDKKWHPINHGGDYRKWYGNNESVINWANEGEEIKNLAKEKYNSVTRTVTGMGHYFKSGITWTAISSAKFSAREFPAGYLFTNAGMCAFGDIQKCQSVLGMLNSKVAFNLLEILSPTLNFGPNQVKQIPSIEIKDEIIILIKSIVTTSKTEWDSHELSWDFQKNELLRESGHEKILLEEAYDLYQQYWKNKFFQIHQSEEELNRYFIKIYGLQDELSSNVDLEDITILNEETIVQNGQLVFKANEVFAQFISYAVGCMFGRYSLEKEGLVLANEGETLQDYLLKIEKTIAECSFLPDDDNIIPVLDNEWFEDDITGRFYEFLKVTFGEKSFSKNLAFVEEQLGKDIRKYFTKDFYADHIKRYKKRPIYWMFSSPNGSFNVLIYLHRYTPDTVSNILNNYLKEFIGKLKTRNEHLQHLQVNGSPAEKVKAIKESDSIEKMLIELHDYERDILFPLATERIAIDLDDGVLVNYNKFGKAVKEVAGLNDKVTKNKVREFDWIDATQIR
ncbi:MAG TPA: BREX-1 system adenine-specific DNA-methyltransferase PglX [Paludibacter sp.]